MPPSSIPQPKFCSHCQLNYPQDAQRCLACGRPEPAGGFPNVALAQEASEVSALTTFYDVATQKATDGGYLRQLRAFEKQIKNKTHVVANYRSYKLIPILESPFGVFGTYLQDLSIGRTYAGSDEWNIDREPAENTTLPGCAQDVRFAALSLNAQGMSYYGNYQIIWDESKISYRTTFFIANCVAWWRDQGKPRRVPPGLRAVWENRHQLAAHKHCDDLSRTTRKPEFATLLLHPDPHGNEGYETFLEAHIWGELSLDSMSRFTRIGDDSKETSYQKKAMRALVGKLKAKGVVVKGL